MGDPRRLRKKYRPPKKLWDETRIKEEAALKKEYGLKNVREIWVLKEELDRARNEAKKSLALPDEKKAEVFGKVVRKLARLNIVGEDATVDDILSLSIKDFLERRLQTRVYRKGMTKTIKQARQLIVHGFIGVDGRRVTSPGMLVTKSMDEKIAYYKDATNVFKQPFVKEEEKAEEDKEKKNEEKKAEGKVEGEGKNTASAQEAAAEEATKAAKPA